MVQIDIAYEGDLRCRARHVPSGTELFTDPPVDNQGRGESFSPTDLVASALGTCMLSIMAIVARRHSWDLSGATARVDKSMIADPERRIGRLAVTIRVPARLESAAREALQRAALACPVHRSLSQSVDIPVAFEWGPQPVVRGA